MTETTEAPAWQRGYDLQLLKAYAEPFKAVDHGIAMGAFSNFRERDVAEALARPTSDGGIRYVESGATVAAALVWRRVRQRQGVKDFTGRVAARMEAGDLAVERLGCLPGSERALSMLLRDFIVQERSGDQAVFIWAWQESKPLQDALAPLPLTEVAVKIPASSELIGVRVLAPRGRLVEHEELPEAETWGLRQLALPYPNDALEGAVRALRKLPGWANHYATAYNKGNTWSAVSLRGFDDDPFFIAKPAEMSKGWKAENADKLDASVRDTVARKALPELEPLIEAIPGEHQRVRLMRLQPGGGELTRHADITDPEAGTGHRKLLRIHLPLISNPRVLFSSWTLQGERYERHMSVGEAWYLDTRKPHTAINGGDTERVHLVVDAYSSPELLQMLEAGSA